GVLATVNFPVSMIAFVLVMNWLYYRCGRSILVPVIFHASANMSAEPFMTHPDSKLIQTGILLIFSAVVVIRDRALFFDRPATVRSSSIARPLGADAPHAPRAGLAGRRACRSEDDHRRKRVCPLVFGGAFSNVAVVDPDPRSTPARPLPHRVPHRGILPDGRY